mmetsp:Transcript_97396/g.252023  ORF Transcript_97396/g.252023 Transcript_97396/m.252023 type:complete len:876 (-) Transcript_97396:89-2716(-)
MPPKAAAKKAAAKKAAAKAQPGNPVAQRDEEVEEVIADLFRLGDPDGSGVIEFGEFLMHHRNIMSATDLDRDEDDAEIEKKFRKHDTDNNQCLDKDEFAAYMKGIFSAVGRKQFLAICKVVIHETEQRIQALEASFNRNFSERLLEQASTVRVYTTESKQQAMSFMEQRADPNLVDKNGSHVLIHAAEKADDVFIKWLIDSRADPSIHNKELDCAAFRAARVRNLDVLEVLLLPGKNTELVDGAQEQRSELSRKLVRDMGYLTGHQVKDMLRERADPNYKDDSGWNPLTAAVFWGKQDCLEALLAAQTATSRVKLRLDRLNGKGRGPLHIAARKGRAELIPLLLKAAADPDAQCSDGWTPLHYAAYNSNNACVTALAECSANLLVQGKHGMTPYMATKMKSRAGNLNEKTQKLLDPPETVSWGKAILPVLKDEAMSFWDKMQALNSLPGVNCNLRNLRIHDQCFNPASGPNKVKLQKLWECFACPLIRRLRQGETDLDPPLPNWAEDAVSDRQQEIYQRQHDQRVMFEAWLWETRGPRPIVGSWEFRNNREAYFEEMQQVVAEELEKFQTELDKIYEKVKAAEGGENLAKMPAEEVLDVRFSSQLGAHPIQSWVQKVDVAGAFSGLRSVGVFGRNADDDECLSAFADLLCLDADFDRGHDFWLSAYRLWLSMYANMVNSEFQRRVGKVVEKFNTMYGEGSVKAASLRSAKPKTIDAIKAKERLLGRASYETYEGRTLAAGVLDLVRCSITVSKPSLATALLDDFFRPLTIQEDKLQLVKVTNRFNEKAETLIGYRDIVLNLHMDFGVMSGACGRDGISFKQALVGEVQIVLEDFIAVRKRRHLLFKLQRGVFDWPTELLPEHEANPIQEDAQDEW